MLRNVLALRAERELGAVRRDAMCQKNRSLTDGTFQKVSYTIRLTVVECYLLHVFTRLPLATRTGVLKSCDSVICHRLEIAITMERVYAAHALHTGIV